MIRLADRRRAVPCSIQARLSGDGGRTWGEAVTLRDGGGGPDIVVFDAASDTPQVDVHEKAATTRPAAQAAPDHPANPGLGRRLLQAQGPLAGSVRWPHSGDGRPDVERRR
jgi:hypothetical protein